MAGFSEIEHIVVLMLENRSFDHMLGALPGVNGIVADDSEAKYELQSDGHWKLNGNESNLKLKPFFNLQDPSDSHSERFPIEVGAPFAIPYGDGPSHSYPSATMQVFGDRNNVEGHVSGNLTPPTNNGFVSSYAHDAATAMGMKERAQGSHWNSEQKSAELRDEMRLPMRCFTPVQVPVISRLAAEFCVCDNWYSEVPGPTEPNRLFMHGATSQGFTHNVSYSRGGYPFSNRTIYQNLEEQGGTWRFYHYKLSDSDQYPAISKEVQNVKDFEPEFAKDVAAGDLPNYTFICPKYSTPANSQHAPHDVRHGENFMADVYEAMRGNESLWMKSLLILVYDEHGGFFDHVFPSDSVPPPDDYTSPTEHDQQQAEQNPRNAYLMQPDYVFEFTRRGLRVPAVLISPWIKRGTVLSHEMQHTSILATVKARFGLPDFLTRRDAAANIFESVLSELEEPREDAPMKLVRPDLPDTPSADEIQKQPLTHPQAELFHLSDHLDGCDDYAQESPPTNQDQFVRRAHERREKHDRYHRERQRSQH